MIDCVVNAFQQLDHSKSTTIYTTACAFTVSCEIGNNKRGAGPRTLLCGRPCRAVSTYKKSTESHLQGGLWHRGMVGGLKSSLELCVNADKGGRGIEGPRGPLFALPSWSSDLRSSNMNTLVSLRNVNTPVYVLKRDMPIGTPLRRFSSSITDFSKF